MRAKEFLIEREPAEQPAADPGAIDQIRNNIITKVQSVSDINELNKVYSYIRKIDLGSGFEGVFAKDEDLRQVKNIISHAIIEAPGSFDEKLGFCKELVSGDGVISLERLFSPGEKQNLMDIVNTDYPEIFNAVAPSLSNIAGAYLSGGKKTNRGKGEFFLAICSPRISLDKRGSGDLDVNGKPVEVKADLARIKGRKGYGTTDAAYNTVKKNVASFMKKNLPDVAGQLDFTVGLGAKSTLWNSEFGDFCMQNDIDPKTVDAFLKDNLKIIVRSLYINLSNADLNEMLNCIAHGYLNFKQFTHINKRAAFEYYQSADKFAGILFINGDTLDFVWCPDAETFQRSIHIKAIGYATGQQNGMQIKI